MTAALPRPAPERIARAAGAIDPVFLHTPLARHDALDARLGCRLLAKVETLNPIRSFKGRGADWALREAADARGPLVTASAGNFGQGLAYAARAFGRPLTVYAAQTASPLKIEAMRRLGAEVILAGDDFDAAKAEAARAASASGRPLFVDGDHPAIAEGAGTIAVEMLRQMPEPPEVVLVPLGNGALAAGVGAWIRAECPAARVVAVAAAGAPAMALSWDRGMPVETPAVDTIADGIAVRVPIPYALDAMRGVVDAVVQVEDRDILRAMRAVHETLGLVVEPAGAAGLAAILADPEAYRGRRVATVLCGGNLTPEQMRRYLFEG